jgi:hypothetical protein
VASKAAGAERQSDCLRLLESCGKARGIMLAEYISPAVAANGTANTVKPGLIVVKPAFHQR